MSRFDVCLAETLKWEGGWSNHPHDTGGATMRGVIQRVYDAWRERNGLARRTVRQIEEHELQAIYRENYWQVVHGDELPPGLDLCVFDYGVNSGPFLAVMHLQEVLGINQDGHMGPVTITAAMAADPAETVRKLCARRRKFVRQIKSYPTFGKGWNRRIDGIEQICGGMCGVPIKGTPVVAMADADAQSETQGRATEVKEGMSQTVAHTLNTATTTGINASLNGIPKPPQSVIDTMGTITAWQGFGRGLSAMGVAVISSPLMIVLVIGLIGAALFGSNIVGWFKK